MQSARGLLEEMARNKKGILTLRKVIGATGKFTDIARRW